MLESHEVDLLGTMQWTQERDEKYSLCKENYGCTIAELAALPDSKFNYEDYKAIENSKVGYIGGYLIENQIKNFMKNRNINFVLIPYLTQTDLDNALENKEIDLIAASSNAVHKNWKLIENFSYAPFFFASWKGNENTTKIISNAIKQIKNEQPDFAINLQKQYIPLFIDASFNEKEVKCIEKKLTYNIYFESNTKPIAWYNSKSNSMEGILVDICNQLQRTTGLIFDIRPKNLQREKINSTTVLYKTVYKKNEEDSHKNKGITNSILTQNFELYHRIGEPFKKDGNYIIAVVENRDGVLEYLKESYPSCTFIQFSSPEKCMNAVKNKSVDLTFLNSHIAENIIITNNVYQITAIPMSTKQIGIALNFYGPDAQTLCEIVNKGIDLLDNGNINNLMMKYALSNIPKMNLEYIIQYHFVAFIVSIIILVIILITLSTLLIFTLILKKERNHEQKINYERSDFFARMSHDLRTPMNGMMGMIELSEDTNDINEIKENMRKAKLSGKYMLSLINDILDLQKLENKKFKLESDSINLNELIENISDMTKTSAQQKDIIFNIELNNIDKDTLIKTDEIRLKQIFLNILSNAIKFTQNKGTVSLKISCIDKNEKNQTFIIEVEDNGIGMSSEFIEKNLFKPYSQEHNKITDQIPGSGLGLAISKNILTLMGGIIKVESKPRKGTKFTIKITFENGEKNTIEAKNNTQTYTDYKNLANKSILICEDNELNAEIIQKLLTKVGCIVTIAKNGKQGIEYFNAAPPKSFDAILMDIRMPILNGFETTEIIRGSLYSNAKTIPIIALTANAYDMGKQKCKEVGMNNHLSKPIETRKLYDTLNFYLSKK